MWSSYFRNGRNQNASKKVGRGTGGRGGSGGTGIHYIVAWYGKDQRKWYPPYSRHCLP